jgi:MoaA/NifB/PqqE/SkfB family radical SAM enzyme
MPLWNNIAELLEYYIPPLPSVYWLDITRECNLRCVMCPQSKGLGRRPAKMTLDTFRRIIDDICESRPLVKLYMSGEPLLHEGLFEMIDYAAAAGCRTMIHTNATILTPEMSERVLSSPLNLLSFSFDGCSPEVYERLRPPARFHEVEANIRQFLDLRRSRGGGPRTTIEIIRMRDTEPLLDGFVDRWKRNGADEVRIVEYMTWHGLVDDRRTDSQRASPGYKPCEAPFRHACILSDGTAVPCCLDVNGRMPMGSLTTRNFREIWMGNDYRRLRLAMLTGALPPDSLCDRCDNTCRALSSELLTEGPK